LISDASSSELPSGTGQEAIINGAYAWDAQAQVWRPWIVATAFGADPGHHRSGAAGVSRLSTGELWSRGMWIGETERDRKGNVRAGMDDSRRRRESWVFFSECMTVVGPHVAGVEVYSTRQPQAIGDLKNAATHLMQLGVPSTRERFIEMLQDDRKAGQWIGALAKVGKTLRDAEGWTPIGLGNASKTIGTQTIVEVVAFSSSVPIYTYEPRTVKKTLTGDAGASKEAIGQAVEKLVIGASEHVAEIVPSKRNHAHDAMAVAVCALYDFEKWRAAYGT
jgi:hypothetical protein